MVGVTTVQVAAAAMAAATALVMVVVTADIIARTTGMVVTMAIAVTVAMLVTNRIPDITDTDMAAATVVGPTSTTVTIRTAMVSVIRAKVSRSGWGIRATVQNPTDGPSKEPQINADERR